jgi:TolA-binding protein
MRKIFWYSTAIIFLNCLLVFAQKTAIYTHPDANFSKAVHLFNEKQYQSAQQLFENIAHENENSALTQDVKIRCDYYIAHAALELNQNGAVNKMEDFLDQNPTSPYQNEAAVATANHYFNQKNYPKALQWYEKVDESALNSEELDQYNFQKGYVFFANKDKKEAANYFNKVINSEVYRSQVSYYLGYLAYEADDYKEANKQFEQVANEDKYKDKMSYFQADMSFKQGQFQKAIDQANLAMSSSNAIEKSELNKIIGECYFNLKQFDKAIPFLAQYKGKNGKWSNTDYYFLGYAFYQQKNYTEAILQFNKIVGGKNDVAQNAYYHLGESYLKTDKKQQALNAFKNASEMTFDEKIQEDASLNYAKLSYELGNSFQSIPEILTSFIEKYPKNPNKAEIESLLLNSYITSKNYEGALGLLEKNKSQNNQKAYQKVTFYRGLELFIDSNYTSALVLFEKSIANSVDKKYTARALFWQGESYYNLEEYRNSLASYQELIALPEAKTISENKNTNYAVAYNYFKLKEYKQAAQYFQNFINDANQDKSKLTDANLRLADCYFVTTQYASAIQAYTKAIDLKTIDSDYANYQKAICYGFIPKNDKKIESLNQFLSTYPKSSYRDDAFFELGNTYVQEKKTENALQAYEKLIAEFKNGSYVSKATLRQGLIYYNSDRDELALTKLKKVAADFPNSSEAFEAVATARLIYVDAGKVDEYAAWVKTLDYVQVTDAEFDNDTYEGAEKQYQQNNTQAAIAGFTNYVSKFPNGINAMKANFYLAQMHYSNNQDEKAIPYYEYVISKPRNEFSEQSLVRLSQLYLKNKDHKKAIPVLKRVESEANDPQFVNYAQANIMKSYYELQEYENSVTAADKVLLNPKIDNKVRSDAQIIIARAAIKTNNESKARAAYAKLLLIAKGELGAEAIFYDAYFKNKDSKYEASNTAVQKLTKEYAGYKYFAAKGLVVMAKNFYGLKDAYQANYILESVIKNFGNFQDVVEQAKQEQAIIQSEEAKTNSSIQK